MDKQRVQHLKAVLSDFNDRVDQKTATKLELEKWDRIVDRLDEFSQECDTCKAYFDAVETHLLQLADQKAEFTKEEVKENHQKVNEIESHLTEKHSLVTSSHYLSIYIALGTSFGLLFGLLFFDNIALGLPIGLAIGVGVGTALDNDAKKKGKTI